MRFLALWQFVNSLPQEIPPISEGSNGFNFWTLTSSLTAMSEKYQSCLIEKLELKGTIKEYEKAMTSGLARDIEFMRSQHLEQISQTNKIILELQNQLESANERINLLETTPQKSFKFLDDSVMLKKGFRGIQKLSFFIASISKDAKFIIADVFISNDKKDHFVIYFQQNCKKN